MNNERHFQFWQKASRRVCRRINAGFCLQFFLPLLLGLTVAQGSLLLILRKLDAAPTFLWIAYVTAGLAALGFSAWWNRKRFFSVADGLVYLEAHLLLHNRLTAARQGHGAWPEPRILPPALRWSWPRLLLPPLAGIGFLLLAGWIPLTQQAAVPFEQPEEPLAWEQIESWAEILKERDLFEEEALAQWQEQLQSLRDQPPEEWYSHNSLEAGDNLRENASDAIRQLQSALEKAAYPLNLARESLEEMPSGLQPLLQEHWLEALAQLESGPIALNKDALAQLSEVDFNNLQTLSQDQIDRLNKMLREGREACGTCPCGICQNGGISRGPGTADLTFREFPNLIDSQRREVVSNPDLSRAALGEQLGASQTAPEVDPALGHEPTAAGEANLSGDGGEAVFHSRLTPAEQRRLREYFQ